MAAVGLAGPRTMQPNSGIRGQPPKGGVLTFSCTNSTAARGPRAANRRKSSNCQGDAQRRPILLSPGPCLAGSAVGTGGEVVPGEVQGGRQQRGCLPTGHSTTTSFPSLPSALAVCLASGPRGASSGGDRPQGCVRGAGMWGGRAVGVGDCREERQSSAVWSGE